MAGRARRRELTKGENGALASLPEHRFHGKLIICLFWPEDYLLFSSDTPFLGLRFGLV